MKGFYDLEVWKTCRQFKNKIIKIARTFPKEEQYRLLDQAVRSSRSINANISEGQGRFHYQENIQFCRQARGSLTETLNHMIDAYDEKYISKQQLKEIKDEYSQCLKLINGYIAYLKKRKDEDL